MVYFYLLFPIKMKYFVLIIGAIAFFSSISPGNSGISHLGHLGGMAFGYVYLRWGYMLNPWRSWATVRHEYYRFRLARMKRRFKVIEGKEGRRRAADAALIDPQCREGELSPPDPRGASS